LSASKAGVISSACRIFDRGGLEAERPNRCLCFAHFQHDSRVTDIGHDRQTAETRNNLAQQFELLASNIGLLDRQAGDVSAGSRETSDEASSNGVIRRRKDDRDGRRGLLCGED